MFLVSRVVDKSLFFDGDQALHFLALEAELGHEHVFDLFVVGVEDLLLLLAGDIDKVVVLLVVDSGNLSLLGRPLWVDLGQNVFGVLPLVQRNVLEVSLASRLSAMRNADVSSKRLQDAVDFL